MKLGLVSDIHCNIQGLDRALELMNGVDQVLCLGDSIYEYRFSNEVIARLIEIDAPTIQGNHEENFLGPLGERARAREGNDPELMEWLSTQPYRREIDYDDKKVLMVHSTPWEPYEEYIYPHSRDLVRLGELNFDIAIYGHTHMQLAREVNGTLIVNPGSAGLGQDPSNGKKLSCAVLETDDRTVAFYNYDMRR